MPAESGAYYTQGINCRHCNYSGQPLNPTVYFYDKAKALHKRVDAFSEELGPEPLSSRMALVSLFTFVVSVGTTMHTFAIVSLAGFLMFSVFYAFMRIVNSR